MNGHDSTVWLVLQPISTGEERRGLDIVEKQTQESERKKESFLLKVKVSGESLLALCDENENNCRNNEETN